MILIEKNATYAETCERTLQWSETCSATFELLPRADDLQTFSVVKCSRDGSRQQEILIGHCYTSVNSLAGVVGFDLDADGLLFLATQSADGRPRSQIFCDTRREILYGQRALVFYVKDALACVESYSCHGSEDLPGWPMFREWVERLAPAEEVDPEFWYVNMVQCGIQHARRYYQSWMKPTHTTVEIAATLAEMIVWMGSDPAFDRRSLQTERKVFAVQRAINLIDRREVLEADGRACHEELLCCLSEDDPFWMKWRLFGRGQGWWK